jgi:hypothetical protein
MQMFHFIVIKSLTFFTNDTNCVYASEHAGPSFDLLDNLP